MVQCSCPIFHREWIIERLAGGGIAHDDGLKTPNTQGISHVDFCLVPVEGSIIVYKTGMPPSQYAVAEGYSLQLCLIGLIADHGGFDEIDGIPRDFEYWSLAKKNGSLGFVATPVGGRGGIDPAEFTTIAARNFAAAAANWLTGDAPFIAKLHPEHAPYGDYDQLMRLDEWYGREGAA